MDEKHDKGIARDVKVIRDLISKFVNAQDDAESEVHEKMRRFAMYMHSLHDIGNMYREMGHPVPAHIERELERLDDRLRQLLEEALSDGNTFEQVRRKMADDPNNRWDHTRAIGVTK
mgnify:CR=1 FL=1